MIWLECSGFRARAIDGDPSDMPPYRALGIVSVYGDIAILSGLVGRVRLNEIRQFYVELRISGCRWLLAQRTGNHRIPFGERIETGPMAGWWQVDLAQFDDDVMERFQ